MYRGNRIHGRMNAETRFITDCHGIPADFRPNHYATMRKGDQARTYGPMTPQEWARLVEQETREGWELAPEAIS